MGQNITIRDESFFKILRRRHKQQTNAGDTKAYTFYGQYFPQLDEFLFKRYFPDVNIPGVFVECGANNGLAASNCKFFEETLHWNGFNLEPTPETFAMLEKNRPSSCNLQVALSDFCGNIEFGITECASPNPHYLGAVNRVLGETTNPDAEKQYPVKKITSVPCITWTQFVQDNNIAFVDLFILDVEGHEPQVIRGMKDCPVLPAVMCVENGWRDSIKLELDRLGYAFDIAHFGNHCYVRKDLLPLFIFRGLHKNC